MIFGQDFDTPTITPEELQGVIQNRPTPMSEYWSLPLTDSFWSSLPGVAVRDFQVPEDDRRDLTNPNDPGSLVAGMIAPSVLGIAGRGSAQEPSDIPMMPEEDWKASPYYREGITFDGRMTPERAKAKAEIYDENQYHSWLRQNRPWGVGTVATAVIGSIAGSAPDPVNYIPVFGPAFKAANASRLTVMMARAGLGAVDAAITTAAEEPLIAYSRRQFGDDMSFADQVLDVALSAAVGGIAGGIGGRLERLPDQVRLHAPDRVSTALQTLGEAADAIANDRHLDIGGAYRQSLLSGSSLSRGVDIGRVALGSEVSAVSSGFQTGRLAGDLTSAEARASGLNPPAFEGALDMPVKRLDGSPAVYPAELTGFKSEIKRLTAAAAKDGRTLELRDLPDGQKMLVETSSVRWLDQFPDEASAKNSLNRLTPDERKGIDIVPFESQARGRGFALIKGASPAQIAEIRADHRLADRIRGQGDTAAAPLSQTPKAPRETFDQAFQATAPKAQPIPAKSLSTVAPEKLRTEPERLAAADAAVGKPQPLDTTGFRERAAEHGMDEAGNFEELGELQAMNENLTADERAALKEADATMKRADDYAKAYQAAANCLMRAAE